MTEFNKKTIFNIIKGHIKLLIESPKDYLYSFVTTNKNKIIIEKFDPKSKELGNAIVAQINSKCPDMPTYFIGSANLDIAGQHDIDIYVACPSKHFDHYIILLEQLFGKYYKHRKEFVEWHITRDTYNIDIVLIDPANKKLKTQLRLFNLLKNNPDYLKEYECIKLSSNGLSSRSYNRKRMAFFNRILK